jgi:hypothetical protein
MFYNRPPEAHVCMDWSDPATATFINEEREAWITEKKALFDDHGVSPYRCAHCGQTNVAYVAAVDHLPSGERLCFGWQCCNRIGLSLPDFKMRFIQSKAKAQLAREALLAKCDEFLTRGGNEEVAAVIKRVGSKELKNSFVCDVVSRFWANGSISKNQAAAIVKSAAREDEFAANKAIEDAKPKADFPSSGERVKIIGTIVSFKDVETMYGLTVKMLVRGDCGNKFWGTVPSGLDAQRGDRIEFFAKCEVSKNDAHFGFFSRPTKASVTTLADPRVAA